MNPDDNHRPACVGRADLFESTNPTDHLEALELCLACPVRDWCAQQRDAVRASMCSGVDIEGTWAGEFYCSRRGSRRAAADALRILREEQAYTDEDAKRAHARFVWVGIRDDWTRVGERVYQRRAARRKAAREAVA